MIIISNEELSVMAGVLLAGGEEGFLGSIKRGYCLPYGKNDNGTKIIDLNKKIDFSGLLPRPIDSATQKEKDFINKTLKEICNNSLLATSTEWAISDYEEDYDDLLELVTNDPSMKNWKVLIDLDERMAPDDEEESLDLGDSLVGVLYCRVPAFALNTDLSKNIDRTFTKKSLEPFLKTLENFSNGDVDEVVLVTPGNVVKFYKTMAGTYVFRNR